MAKKQMLFKTKGMNRDLSVSAFNPEFAFENMNLRLSTNEGNTMMSWVNERGTAQLGLNKEDHHWYKDGKEDVEGEKTSEIARTLELCADIDDAIANDWIWAEPEEESPGTWSKDDVVYEVGEGETQESVAEILPKYLTVAEAEAGGWGWSKYSNTSIEGTPIGTAVLNHKLVLFTTEGAANDDHIYTIEYIDDDKTQLLVTEKYGQNIGLDENHPLETLVSYESENIQKVYWVDGKNQPRVINIVADNISNKPDTYFDFIPTLQLKETITVEKMLGASGTFAPGVIQYAFTYYNKHGQESNIFYTTPLYYISHKDRGASPEEKVDNAFKITITNVDKNFNYLRIYSIQRTSINGTPICKRIQDVDIQSLKDAEGIDTNTASYTDLGTSGESVDPTELLYKGGESIIANTLEQKDGTLFLGNFRNNRESLNDLKEGIQNNIEVISEEIPEGENVPEKFTRTITIPNYAVGDYAYGNQLTAVDNNGYTVPCGGFKRGDWYRCGVQLQHKTGKWSEPIFINDVRVLGTPDVILDVNNEPTNQIKLPTLRGKFTNSTLIRTLVEDMGYKKIRPVVVFPEIKDRITLCQGIVNPTLYTDNHRTWEDSDTHETKGSDDLYAQSSWFFRPYLTSDFVDNEGAVYPHYGGAGETLEYTGDINDINNYYVPSNIRQVEVQGVFSEPNQFKIGKNVITFHSPDIEFEEQFKNMNYTGLYYRRVGTTIISKTLSTIDIQTETPAIKSREGFVKKSFSRDSAYGIVSGLFYDDFVVDDKSRDDNIVFESYDTSDKEGSSAKWMVYLWNKSGSLNNDINRPADKGTPSAILKKKIVSNLRYAALSEYLASFTDYLFTTDPQLFASDEVTVSKIGGKLYQGNIDTILLPDSYGSTFFAYESDSEEQDSDNFQKDNVITPFTSTSWWATYSTNPNKAAGTGYGLAKLFQNNTWHNFVENLSNKYNVGKYYIDLVTKREGVKMKYKSTAHLILGDFSSSFSGIWPSTDSQLPIIEISRGVTDNNEPNGLFGGKSTDALKENTWIPCGEPVSLEEWDATTETYIPKSVVEFEYSYGDTYFQRWDCLKTYPFTREDVNQLVEIGSFMLETHVNIDGRYDRNRGQINNLNMSPVNFNLLNPVYSQKDNFFSYKILDDSYYDNTKYINQITWSKTKEAGADVDLWTNITLASVLELDGDKGELNKIIRFNNYLFAFQDTGISQILYNDNVQIQSTQGVPIEIANSGKVSGKDYKSSSIGCSNKWSMVTTPNGIYFMDSNDKSIYLFNGQLTNISQAGGFNSWCKLNIPSASVKWTPVPYNKEGEVNTGGFDNFVCYYDKLNQDVLYIDHKTALAWSEKMQAFTSFYNYGNTPFFVNLDDTGIWISKDLINQDYKLWRHQTGNYCSFFGINKPYWMTLVGNPEPQMDKIFTNLEFRACIDIQNEGDDAQVPFDRLETWNEYQHGIANIDIRKGHSLFKHHLISTTDFAASLIRKFRIWRCDIPRDNTPKTADQTINDNYTLDSDLGIFRYDNKPVDRMRNPWLYLKLYHSEPSTSTLKRTEIHDIVMTYFT